MDTLARIDTRLALAALSLAALAGCPAPQPQPTAKPGKPTPAPKVVKRSAPAPASLTDKGLFRLYKNENPLVTINFQWQGGRYRAKRVLSIGGQSVTTTMTVDPGPDGGWQKIAIRAPTGVQRIVRAASTAKLTYKKKSVTFKLSRPLLLFESFAPTLMSLALARYDVAKGGEQKYQVFFVAGKTDKASIELKQRADRMIGGKPHELLRYKVGLPGVDLQVWADARHKVYLIDVPAQHAAYVRDGYEVLRLARATDR